LRRHFWPGVCTICRRGGEDRERKSPSVLLFSAYPPPGPRPPRHYTARHRDSSVVARCRLRRVPAVPVPTALLQVAIPIAKHAIGTSATVRCGKQATISNGQSWERPMSTGVPAPLCLPWALSIGGSGYWTLHRVAVRRDRRLTCLDRSSRWRGRSFGFSDRNDPLGSAAPQPYSSAGTITQRTI
jgi:hypothetical protein